MCLNSGYVTLSPNRRINLKAGTVTRWKVGKSSKTDYYRAKENGQVNTRYWKTYKTGCGKCPECRAKRADEWGTRGYLQTIEEPNGVFVTLTYSTENLPDFGHLSIRDTQLFKKRLRWKLDYPIKTLESGEYGELNGRPHYHMLIWGLKLPQDVRKTDSKSGYANYRSMWLEQIWGKGIVTVAPITLRNIKYAARYTAKKINEKIEEKYVKPYIIVSKGLAREYWERNREKILKDGNIIVWDEKKGAQTKAVPRYFKKLYDVEEYGLKEGDIGRVKRECDKAEREYNTTEWRYKVAQRRIYRNRWLNNNRYDCKIRPLPEKLKPEERKMLHREFVRLKKEKIVKRFMKKRAEEGKGWLIKDELELKNERVQEFTPIEIHELQLEQARHETKQRLLKEAKQTEEEYDQKAAEKKREKAMEMLKLRNTF